MDVMQRLVLALPAQSNDVEEQARAVLRILFGRIMNGVDTPPKPNVVAPTACPNCGILTPATRTPYCSERCRESAGFVRQVRAGLSDGSILDEQRQVAFGQVLWHLLGGGRPLRVHLIPDKARLQVLARDRNTCMVCGAPAATVDHIATGCNRTINLRAVCDDCNQTKPFGDKDLLLRPEVVELLAELSTRIASPNPLRPCDDAAAWDWREFLVERKVAMEKR